MSNLNHYQFIADLFDYPDAVYPDRARRARDVIAKHYPAAVPDVERFLDLLPASDLITMQELYTRTFDVQAITTLDLGYVLFGDDYKRGELLANMNREHQASHNDCGSELADHLPNVLRLMPLLEDDELLLELVQEIVAPAVSQMSQEFSVDRVQKKYESYEKQYKTLIELPTKSNDVATLYQFLLRALYIVLKTDFKITERIPLAATSDFLKSLTTENEIENRAEGFY